MSGAPKACALAQQLHAGMDNGVHFHASTLLAPCVMRHRMPTQPCQARSGTRHIPCCSPLGSVAWRSWVPPFPNQQQLSSTCRTAVHKVLAVHPAAAAAGDPGRNRQYSSRTSRATGHARSSSSRKKAAETYFRKYTANRAKHAGVLLPLPPGYTSHLPLEPLKEYLSQV